MDNFVTTNNTTNLEIITVKEEMLSDYDDSNSSDYVSVDLTQEGVETTFEQNKTFHPSDETLSPRPYSYDVTIIDAFKTTPDKHEKSSDMSADRCVKEEVVTVTVEEEQEIYKSWPGTAKEQDEFTEDEMCTKLRPVVLLRSREEKQQNIENKSEPFTPRDDHNTDALTKSNLGNRIFLPVKEGKANAYEGEEKEGGGEVQDRGNPNKSDVEAKTEKLNREKPKDVQSKTTSNKRGKQSKGNANSNSKKRSAKHGYGYQDEQSKSGVKIYLCSYCSKIFSSKSKLTYHVQSHVQPFTCKICNRKFGYKQKLRAHLLIHDDIKPFECTFCNKKCRTKGLLKDHLRTHNVGTKSLQCSYCERTFTHSTYLKRHTYTHTGNFPHFCPNCSKGFYDYTQLTVHMRKHTREESLECDQCNKSFVTRASLVNHLKSHPGVKPFSCQYCNHEFFSKQDRQTHIETQHKGEKLYTCLICEERFIDEEELRTHIKIHI